MKFPILHLLLLLLCCAACGGKKEEAAVVTTTTKTTNDRVFGIARIEPEDGITDLVAGTSGKVLSVLIDENQSIKKGQTLMTVDQSVEKSQLLQAKSKIGPQTAAITTQRANVETLKINLRNAQTILQRNTALFNGKALTKEELDNSQFEVDRYQKEIAEAEAKVAEANSKIDEIKTDITYFETVLGQKKVLAPMGGKILKVNVKAGEYVQNDLKIAEFAPDGALVAKTEVDEIFADRIQLGQKALLLSQTTGDTIAQGTVYFAADYLKAKSLFKDQSTEQEDRRIREVHIKIEAGAKPLIGSRVDCIILLK